MIIAISLHLPICNLARRNCDIKKILFSLLSLQNYLNVYKCLLWILNNEILQTQFFQKIYGGKEQEPSINLLVSNDKISLFSLVITSEIKYWVPWWTKNIFFQNEWETQLSKVCVQLYFFLFKSHTRIHTHAHPQTQL